MLKELVLLVTLLTLLADARPQRFQVCDHWDDIIDHWDDFMQKPLNVLDEMSEEVDINGPLTFDDDLLNNNDDIRENSESLTFQHVSINDIAFPMARNHAYLFLDVSMNTAECIPTHAYSLSS
eukprot:Em0001g316a